MSVWDAYGSGSLVRPGTPDITIRYADATNDHVVCADGVEVYRCPDYRPAHRWAQNKYGLTSTPMTAVYADYAADLEARLGPMFAKDSEGPAPEAAPQQPQNKYRKEGK